MLKIKKMFKCLFAGLIAFVLLFTINFNAIASEINSYSESDAYTYEVDILPEWQDTIDSAPLNSQDFSRMNIIEMLSFLLFAAQENFFGPLTLFASMCAAIIIVSAVKSLSENKLNNSMFSLLDSIAAVFAFTLASTHLLGIMQVLQIALIDGEIYLKAFIPIFAGVLLSCGQIGASAIYSSIFLTIVNISAQLLTGIIMPFVKIIFAFYAAAGIDETINLNKLAKDAIKWLKWFLGAVATLFATVLSLQTIFAQSADSAAMRAGKFLVGASVPVVGRAVSDALSSVFAGMKVVKGSVGFAAIAVIVAAFLPVIVQCVLYHLSFSLSSLVAGATGNAKMQNFLDGCVSCIGILIAMILFFCLIIVSSTLLMIVIGMGS